ncbi:ABC transporter permease [Thalassospira indica]|uniref:ABC transporter permease n=1 Tax=Thalassospira indica TaxID=1891279 RepID=A0ABM6XWU3_9PROT|nr:ABC transporter permease [Thalassospira indica]AXO14155.1 ABC transporter permease [Thalassospira indica]OAZ12374.1 ABC transporter permease [Thalassospira profundimaris]
MKMKSPTALIPGLYLTLFFAYLFGPLIIMVITAFNSSTFPRVSPWECFTTDWFGKLASDDKLLSGLGNSLLIGVGVVCVAIPIGLAAAITLSQVGPKLRAALYTIFIAPILVPGVVIGLSTLIFWDRIGTLFNAPYESFFYDGTFLTIFGQVTFIAAYSMLVFLSRIQRFDITLTEAALDMGATPTQAFVKVLLPFMAPAIGSATVLAFLASLENYNTTVFTIVSSSTFTTVLSSKVRYGLDPSISAVAVIIIAITLIGAIIYECRNRYYTKGWAHVIAERPALKIATHPGTVAVILGVLTLAAVLFIQNHDSSVCTAQVLEEKRALQQQLMEQQSINTPQQALPAPTMPNLGPLGGDEGGASAPSPFGNNIFSPENLGTSAPEGN